MTNIKELYKESCLNKIYDFIDELRDQKLYHVKEIEINDFIDLNEKTKVKTRIMTIDSILLRMDTLIREYKS